MIDSRTALAAIMRNVYAYDVNAKDSAEEVVVSLRAEGWRVVHVDAVAAALRILGVDEDDYNRAAIQMLAVIDDIQGELDVADSEVMFEEED